MNIIKINGYNFEGPYDFVNTNFNEVPRVYAIVEQNKLIYVGITDNLKERMANHHKENCWRKNISTTNCLYVLRVDSENDRQIIERGIIDKYNPICNDK